MNRLVLDASVALAWFFQDEGDLYAQSILNHLNGARCLVPSHWHLEIANALCLAERKGRISSAELARITALMKVLPIDTDAQLSDHSLTEVYSIVRTSSLTAYDAVYVELCRRANLSLATLDRELLAAIPGLGVNCFIP